MSDSVRYITNEQGQRVGVLLDLETYNQLAHLSVLDPDSLTGLSSDELNALADSLLAPTAQVRLDDLLSRNAESKLSDDENTELDCLLGQVDQLTLLKTRARYTRNHLEGAATAS